jgi:predicted RNA-binding protein with PUA-like domain
MTIDYKLLTMTNYWLIKSEGECYGIDHLKKDRKTSWAGVRNYRARNFMMNDMRVGDIALFYHSNGDTNNPTGIYGLAKVSSKPHPDLSAQDSNDEHYDPKATKDKPIWCCVDFSFVKKFKSPLTLFQIKDDPILKHMMVAQKGMRLSIMPVSDIQFNRIVEILEG